MAGVRQRLTSDVYLQILEDFSNSVKIILTLRCDRTGHTWAFEISRGTPHPAHAVNVSMFGVASGQSGTLLSADRADCRRLRLQQQVLETIAPCFYLSSIEPSTRLVYKIWHVPGFCGLEHRCRVF